MAKKDTETALTFDPDLPICTRLHANSLYRLCAPFLLLMRLGGAFFLLTSKDRGKTPDRCEFRRSRKSRRTRPRSDLEIYEILSKLYSVFSLFCVCLYTGRFMLGMAFTLPEKLEKFATGRDFAVLLAKFSNGVWFVHVVAVQLIFLRACWRQALFYRLFMKWEDWRYISGNTTCQAFSERFLPRRNIVTAGAVIALIPQILSVWIPSMCAGPELTAFTHMLYDGFTPRNPAVMATTIIGHFYASFIYIVPVFLFVLIALAIEGEFARLNYDFTQHITEQDTIDSGLIEVFRRKHGKLCEILDLADGIFSLFSLITIGVGVYQIFSLVFVFCAFGADEYRGYGMTLVQAYWFLIYVLQPGFLMWAGMRVNQAAHSPLPALYRLDQTQLPIQETLQLQTFIGRLTTTRLGFTAWKMFTIDASALLSLLGLYVTYQLLLFQVQLELSSSNNSPSINTPVDTTNKSFSC